MKTKGKNLDDFENGNSNFRVFTREIRNLRWLDSLYLSACDGVQIQNVMIEDFRALKDAVEDLNR